MARKAKQQAKVEGQNNFVIQIKGDGNTITVGLPHLTLTRYLTQRGRKESDTELLSARGMSIPMIGRDDEMADLWAWLKSKAPISVRVMTAGAGTGKTRLALELCDAAIEKRWFAGLATDRELGRFIAQQNLSDWGWQKPCLIVVDYAAARAGELHDWFVELADNAGDPKKPLRILLLERHADPTSGWWQQAFGSGGEDALAVRRLLDPADGPVPLIGLADAKSRRKILNEVLKARGKDVRAPAAGKDPDFDRRLAEITWAGEPLFLMMAGLLAAREGFGHVLALSRTDLAFDLADGELARIDRIAKEAKVDKDFLRHMAAYVTLCQGLGRDAVEDAIAAEQEALRFTGAGDPPVVAAALHTALPGEDRAIEPVQPDMIGEAAMLRAFGALSDKAAAETVARAAGRALSQVAASVMRTAQDYASDEQTAPLDWLDTLVREGANDPNMLLAIANQLPEHTLVLRERAAGIYAKIADAARKRIDSGDREGGLPILGTALTNLASRLNDLGRRDEAYAAAEQSVALFRDLAAAKLDAFRPNLAGSLTNFANRLSDLGRREEALVAAEEAIALYGDLVALRPDAFRPELAGSLNNVVAILSDLGRREEALEVAEDAVALFRDLAVARPDAFRPDLAMSLNNLANVLSALGRREEARMVAEDALDLYRELAAARPDAFRSELALSLNNLTGFQSDLGLRLEAVATAEEALDLYRELAAARPNTFLHSFAGSFNNLANRLSDLGRREEALEAAEQSVALFRDLAEVRPDAFRPEHAVSLDNLASRLRSLDRWEEALVAAEQALAIRRDLAGVWPETFRPELAGSLNNFAAILSDLGRREEALEVAEEAVALFRDLAVARPGANQPGLAGALSNLATRLSDIGRREEALAVAEKAVVSYRELAAAWPDAFCPEFARSLSILANRLKNIGRPEKALEASVEALKILSPFFLAQPQAFERWMRTMAGNYVQQCKAVDREPNTDLLEPIVRALLALDAQAQDPPPPATPTEGPLP